MQDNKYNGWTNYETWLVNLWLTNEEATYRYWRDEAQRHADQARESAPVRDGLWLPEEAVRINLSEQLKDEITAPLPDQLSGLFADLITAALAEVDWSEIAESLLADIEPAPEANFPESAPPSTGAPKFPMGIVVATPGALDCLTAEETHLALMRHHRGDWGEVCAEDQQENERSLRQGSRLLSAYRSADGTRFWVITEADRSATTILLPQEY